MAAPTKLDSPEHVEHLQRTIERRDENVSSTGDRAAARVVRTIGNWRFIGGMAALLVVWVGFNTFVAVRWLSGHGFDPYPFAILNLGINGFGAFTLPVILLAENLDARQARLTIEHAAAESEQDRRESAELRRLVAEQGERLERMTSTLEELMGAWRP